MRVEKLLQKAQAQSKKLQEQTSLAEKVVRWFGVFNVGQNSPR